MGITLGKLAKEETFGGRGSGRLKQTTIDKLTTYYGKVIRGNQHNLEKMRSAVFCIRFRQITNLGISIAQLVKIAGVFTSMHYLRERNQALRMTMLGLNLPMQLLNESDLYNEHLGDENLLQQCLLGKTQIQGLGGCQCV